MKNYLAAIMMAMAFVSCDPAETPANLQKKEISIRIESDYLETNEPAWVFLHDIEGNPLDFRPISNNSNLVFEIDSKLERIQLTIVKKQEGGSFDRYSVETISGAPTQLEFTLGLKSPSRSNPLEPAGEFEVNISANQHLSITTVSSSQGHISGIGSYGGFQSYAKMTLSHNASNYLVTTRSDAGDIKYAKISSPQNGSVHNFNFGTELFPFDKVLKIPYYQVGNLIYAVKVLQKETDRWKESYWLNTNIMGGEQAETEYQIGYLNEFPHYETSIMATVSSQITAGLVKVGSAPNSLQLPLNKNINLLTSKISHVTFTSDMAFNNWSGDWRLRDGSGNLTVIWNIWGKESGFTLKAFPLEFTAAHPQFSDLDQMQLFSMKLMQSHKEYDNLVESKYAELKNIEETEEYYLTRRF